jgi:hypothetical protein
MTTMAREARVCDDRTEDGGDAPLAIRPRFTLILTAA